MVSPSEDPSRKFGEAEETQPPTRIWLHIDSRPSRTMAGRGTKEMHKLIPGGYGHSSGPLQIYDKRSALFTFEFWNLFRHWEICPHSAVLHGLVSEAAWLFSAFFFLMPVRRSKLVCYAGGAASSFEYLDTHDAKWAGDGPWRIWIVLMGFVVFWHVSEARAIRSIV